MSRTIDFEKVDAAFQHLADTPEGNAALNELNRAIEDIGKFNAKLNADEFKYLITHLINQRNFAHHTPNAPAAKPTAKAVGNFTIHTAVPVSHF